jgi:hypothetical protein
VSWRRRRHLSRLFFDPDDRQAIVTAVASVDEPTVRVNADIRELDVGRSHVAGDHPAARVVEIHSRKTTGED